VREENAKGGKRAEEYAAAALDAQGKQAFPAGFHNLLERAACGCGENTDGCCRRSYTISPAALPSRA
jgi:hypothetical protein